MILTLISYQSATELAFIHTIVIKILRSLTQHNHYREILQVSPRSSASKMFVDNNILNIEALLR